MAVGLQDFVLEEEIDKFFEPTEEEILEYALWLGFELPQDQSLLWIAKEGLKAPLPSEWKPCRTEEDEIYYYNFATGESSWDHPCDHIYRDIYRDEMQKYRQQLEVQPGLPDISSVNSQMHPEKVMTTGLTPEHALGNDHHSDGPSSQPRGGKPSEKKKVRFGSSSDIINDIQSNKKSSGPESEIINDVQSNKKKEDPNDIKEAKTSEQAQILLQQGQVEHLEMKLQTAVETKYREMMNKVEKKVEEDHFSLIETTRKKINKELESFTQVEEKMQTAVETKYREMLNEVERQLEQDHLSLIETTRKKIIQELEGFTEIEKKKLLDSSKKLLQMELEIEERSLHEKEAERNLNYETRKMQETAEVKRLNSELETRRQERREDLHKMLEEEAKFFQEEEKKLETFRQNLTVEGSKLIEMGREKMRQRVSDDLLQEQILIAENSRERVFLHIQNIVDAIKGVEKKMELEADSLMERRNEHEVWRSKLIVEEKMLQDELKGIRNNSKERLQKMLEDEKQQILADKDECLKFVRENMQADEAKIMEIEREQMGYRIQNKILQDELCQTENMKEKMLMQVKDVIDLTERIRRELEEEADSLWRLHGQHISARKARNEEIEEEERNWTVEIEKAMFKRKEFQNLFEEECESFRADLERFKEMKHQIQVEESKMMEMQRQEMLERVHAKILQEELLLSEELKEDMISRVKDTVKTLEKGIFDTELQMVVRRVKEVSNLGKAEEVDGLLNRTSKDNGTVSTCSIFNTSKASEENECKSSEACEEHKLEELPEINDDEEAKVLDTEREKMLKRVNDKVLKEESMLIQDLREGMLARIKDVVSNLEATMLEQELQDATDRVKEKVELEKSELKQMFEREVQIGMTREGEELLRTMIPHHIQAAAKAEKALEGTYDVEEIYEKSQGQAAPNSELNITGKVSTALQKGYEELDLSGVDMLQKIACEILLSLGLRDLAKGKVEKMEPCLCKDINNGICQRMLQLEENVKSKLKDEIHKELPLTKQMICQEIVQLVKSDCLNHVESITSASQSFEQLNVNVISERTRPSDHVVAITPNSCVCNCGSVGHSQAKHQKHAECTRQVGMTIDIKTCKQASNDSLKLGINKSNCKGNFLPQIIIHRGRKKTMLPYGVVALSNSASEAFASSSKISCDVPGLGLQENSTDSDQAGVDSHSSQQIQNLQKHSPKDASGNMTPTDIPSCSNNGSVEFSRTGMRKKCAFSLKFFQCRKNGMDNSPMVSPPTNIWQKLKKLQPSVRWKFGKRNTKPAEYCTRLP